MFTKILLIQIFHSLFRHVDKKSFTVYTPSLLVDRRKARYRFPARYDDNGVGAENKRASRRAGANSENELFPNSVACERRQRLPHHQSNVAAGIFRGNG